MGASPEGLFRVGKCTMRHVDGLIADVREVDRQEWQAATGMSFRYLLRESVKASNPRDDLCRCISFRANNEPLVIWGVNQDKSEGVGGTGIAWMVATNKAVRYALALLKAFRDSEMRLLDQRFEYVQCWADSRNTVHHDWLAWMGFARSEDLYRMGPTNHPFFHFYRFKP